MGDRVKATSEEKPMAAEMANVNSVKS